MKKIAIVHDYLFAYGGAERVLEALHEIYPQAPVYTAWVDWRWLRQNKPEWKKWNIHTSWFDQLPFKSKLCSPLRFLTPLIWRSFDLSEFDIVISSSAWYMAKGVSLNKVKRQKHICYCHTPPRYLYGYDTARSTKHPLIKLYANLVNPFMRYYDFKSSQAVDQFVANSKEVSRRIWKFYRQKAKIIYPPVKLKAKSYQPKAKSKKYFLMVNRLVASKNTDMAVKACLQTGVKLKIVGEGPEEQKLKAISQNIKEIEFLGYVDEQRLSELYAQCKAIIYLPRDEDFGMVPVEAMSYGKPVIGVNGGGVKETVINGKTGILVDKPEVKNVVTAINQLKKLKIKAKVCQQQAAKFSVHQFRHKLKKMVASC